MILAEIGITVLGDVKHIIRCLQSATSKTEEDKKVDLSTRIKTPAEKLSQLQAEMTNPQFRKFRVDWSVFKKITNIMDNQIHAQLMLVMTLYKMIKDHIIAYVNGAVSAGKESVLFWGVDDQDVSVALKIYLVIIY